jgi:hypothetical protein
MTRSRIPALAIAAALLLAPPAGAATAAGGAAPPRPAAAAKPSATAKSRRAAPTAPPAPSATAAERRLEDVHIEGELEVPRVTFITVRQPHRFTDYARATSVRSSRRMAADATFPAWMPAPQNTASEARKESRK